MIRTDSPIFVELELTDKCNLECNPCPNKKSAHGNHILDYKNVIDQILLLGTKKISITGGEPLLEKKRLFDLIDYAIDKGLQVVLLTTNANNLDVQSSNFLSKNKVIVRVELHSIIKEKYFSFTHSDEFSNVLHNMKNALSLGTEVVPYLQLKPGMIDEIEPYFRLCYELGVKKINISDYPLLPWKIDEYREAVSIINKLSKKYDKIMLLSDLPLMCLEDSKLGGMCLAGRLYFHVKANGDVFACRFIDRSFGNIGNVSLYNIWNSAEFTELANPSKDCLGCNLLKNCAGGCKARSYNLRGKFELKDPLCHR